MGFFEEYALLIAVALPAGIVAGMNLLLYLAGERGTLLLPGVHAFPPVDIEPPAAPEARPFESAEPPTHQPFEHHPREALKQAA